MRVLLTTDAVGGVWTFTKELSLGLLEAGADVTLASVGPAPSPTQLVWARTTDLHSRGRFVFHSIDAPLEWMQANDTAYTAAAPALLELAREADLIHVSQFCFGALPTATPVLITAHSDVLSWAAACRPEPLPPTPWLTRYTQLAATGLEHAAAVTAPTFSMLHALAANFALPPHQVIPNGRTLTPTVQTERKLQAVTCGRLWDEAKNIGLLEQVTSPMPIFVAGPTTHDSAEAPASLGPAHLLGQLSEADTLSLFRASSLYLCTSRYEPFGLAPLEAALCGCAILAHDIASLREVWGDAALYFTGASSLSDLLQNLAANPGRLVQAQQDAATRAALYTRKAMTEAYLAAYGQCPSRPEATRAA